MSTPNHSPLLWLTLRGFPPGGHMVRRTQNGTYKICPGSLLTMLGLKPWMHKSAGDFYESLLSWNECNLSKKKKECFTFFPLSFSSFLKWEPPRLEMEPGCFAHETIAQDERTNRTKKPELTLCRPGNQGKASCRNSSGRAPVWKLQERPRSSKSNLGRWWQGLLEFRSLGPCKSRCKG